MFTRRVKILGRAIPVWAVITFACVIVAAAGFFMFLTLGNISTIMAEAPGPVLIGGEAEIGCFIRDPEGDPEGFGTTCVLTANVGEADHSVAVDGVYPGTEVILRIPVENHDPADTVYGQEVDLSALPPGVEFTNSPLTTSEFCGLALASGAWGGYDYRLLFDVEYDGAPFSIPFLWETTAPLTCPSY